MNKVDITIKKKKYSYQVPSEWNELTAEQLKLIAPLYFGAYLVPDAQVRLIATIIPFGVFTKANSIQRYEICSLLSFLNDIKLTKNFFPEFAGLFGPKDELRNVTVLEYATADAYFKMLIKTQEIKYLDFLVATLYRLPKFDKKEEKPQDWDGDYRQKFNPNLVEDNLKNIRKLPISFKYCVFLFFVGCKSKIIEDYSILFSGQNGDGGNGWADTILDLAEAQLFGDLEKSATTYIHTAFMYFERKYLENKQLEAKYGAS